MFRALFGGGRERPARVPGPEHRQPAGMPQIDELGDEGHAIAGAVAKSARALLPITLAHQRESASRVLRPQILPPSSTRTTRLAPPPAGTSHHVFEKPFLKHGWESVKTV
jgi:hypothetical protein